ncbi:hypothetical protein [Halopiger xanaduensis]|uniref:DUF1467 domain-containing protein n=1 Tax=Halopiger xanaduensis (strain DSM 18323 / JCM 14033 / SH-6) TaxID=797210 RepID=F8DCP9_HALXS|nr:hypothetical protein [Halopiger xanaduensis]AEH37223.1 hypothetical protein Halxa_2605 [Halopiger xanaduensis SH-6]
MTRSISAPPSALLVGSVAIAAAGVAVNTGLNSPYRLVPALLLLSLGVAGVTDAAREYGVDRLRTAATRWWTVAFVAFLPYALAAAPESAAAAAAGDAFAGPIVGLALESIVGALVCCAIALTVLYGFARYGIHPGRPSPEERLLADDE